MVSLETNHDGSVPTYLVITAKVLGILTMNDLVGAVLDIRNDFDCLLSRPLMRFPGASGVLLFLGAADSPDRHEACRYFNFFILHLILLLPKGGKIVLLVA